MRKAVKRGYKTSPPCAIHFVAKAELDKMYCPVGRRIRN